MKATQQQYEEAVRLYEEGSCGDVYDYANKLGIDEWSECVLCDAVTPDCHDGACFVCGSPKKKQRVFEITETCTYHITAGSAEEAEAAFLDHPNPSELLTGVTDRTIEEV